MKGSGCTIPIKGFTYSGFRYVTWDAHEVADNEGNVSVEFDYAEAEADATDDEMVAIVLAELTKTGEEDRVDTIIDEATFD